MNLSGKSLITQLTESNQQAMLKRRYSLSEKFHSPRDCVEDFSYYTTYLSSLSSPAVFDGVSMEDRSDAYRRYCVATMMQRYGTPCYWISENLFPALERTKTPHSMPLDSINWPFPVVTFMPPKGSLINPEDGKEVTSITAAKLESGKYTFHNPDLVGSGVYFRESFVQTSQWVFFAHIPGEDLMDNSMIFLHAPISGEKAIDTVGGLFQDWDGSQRYTNHKEKNSIVQDLTPLEEEFEKKCFSLAITTLLILTSRPELDTGEVCTRKEKIRKGKVRDALYGPRIIGESYKVTRKGKSSGTVRKEGEALQRGEAGDWRAGHSKLVYYGKNRSKSRIQWIEPYQIGLDLLE